MKESLMPLPLDEENQLEGGGHGGLVTPPSSGEERTTKIVFFLAFVVLLVYDVTVSSGPEDLSSVYFLERDPRVSFPHKQEKVTVAALEAISIGIPLFVIFVVGFFLKLKPHASATHQTSLFNCWFFLVMSLAQSLLLTGGLTNTIKVLVLRPRPNFFAYCNYKNFNSAQQNGNYSSYDAATSTNAVGIITSCLAASGSVNDSVLSFPSGHSSLSWAGMSFVALLYKFVISQRRRWSFVSIDGLVFVAPLFLSGWVAITRIQDYYHHCDDVLAGTALGVVCTYCTWKSCEAALNQFLTASSIETEYSPVNVNVKS